MVPGPGKYQRTSSMGVQADANKSSAAMHSFGTCDRDRAALASLGPLQANSVYGGLLGPGPATLGAGTGSVGAQPKSTKKSAPSWGFGNELRFRVNKASSELSPGPGTYVT